VGHLEVVLQITIWRKNRRIAGLTPILPDVMTSENKYCAFFLVLVLYIFLNSVAHAQSLSTVKPKLIRSETYDRVLDILFPRTEPGIFSIALRYEPNSGIERQVVIVRTGLHDGEVFEYTSLSGNIYQRLNSLIESGAKEDPAELAKMIKVAKRGVRIPYLRLRSWHDSLLFDVGDSMTSLKAKIDELDSGVTTIPLDGTTYRFWYHQVGSDVSLSFNDQAMENLKLKPEFDIVKTMIRIQREVAEVK
jgi:hypothetical protein